MQWLSLQRSDCTYCLPVSKSVQAGKQAFGSSDVFVILLAESMAQRRFFYMYPIEQRRQARQEDDGESEPVARKKSDRQQDEQQPCVRRMAYEAEEAGAM